MRRTITLATAGVLAVGALIPAQQAAGAPAAAPVHLVTQGLVTPLSFAVTSGGTAYVAQNFTGQLLKVAPGKAPKVLYRSKGGNEVGAVSLYNGRVTFAVTAAKPDGTALLQLQGGKVRKVAAIGKYERLHNPDAGKHYGFFGLSSSCIAKFPAGQPAKYSGIVDSHPYASVTTADAIYVADAAANGILKVGNDGSIHSLALFPGRKVTITKSMLDSANAADPEAPPVPSCVVGHTYLTEPVPTDVELGPDGWLYVSLLPGGPEDPSWGARGEVWKVNPANGKTAKVATGFLGATNLAVSSGGAVYVAELYSGKLTKVLHGKHRTVVSRPLIGAAEIQGNKLYFTDNVLPPDNAPPNGGLKWVSLG